MISLGCLLSAACGSEGGGSTTATGGAGGAATGTGGAATGTGGAGGGAVGEPPCAAWPSGGVYAKFDVAGEAYYASITNPMGINQAIALWKGSSNANIPNGNLVCSAAPYNCPFRFYQDPASITFAEVTIEVCDGAPSYVDMNCASFGARYCPWSAKLVELRDCRTDAACPVVPK
jgi:hypothetical protein